MRTVILLICCAPSIALPAAGQAPERLARREPRNLWHALLFVSCGLIVSEALERSGVRGNEMYADANRMFDRAYRGWRPAIVAHWPAFLAGRLSRREAIDRIVAELPS